MYGVANISSGAMYLYVNGVSVIGAQGILNGLVSLTGIVAPGSTYSLGENLANAVTIYYWMELR